MAVVNLASKYSTLLDKRFTEKSLTDQWCGHDYDWDGVDSIKVWTLGQAEIYDYSTSGAYRFTGGNVPTELDDELNTYPLLKKRSFSKTIDLTLNQDQMNIKKANAILKQIWDEQMVPEIDQHRLFTWAAGAGTAVASTTTLDKDTVVRALLVAGSTLNNHHVNRDNRVYFVSESLSVDCKLAAQLQYNESYTNKTIVNGQISKLNGSPIVAVPDDYMPEGVSFMLKYKRSSADPMKLKMLRSHSSVPGLAGNLLEGLVRYDSFVLAQKAYGIYVFGSASNVAPTPAISNSGTTGTINGGTSGLTIVYTLDGSNPKTSGTATTVTNVQSTTCTVTTGTVVRAYTKASGKLDSGIASYVAT